MQKSLQGSFWLDTILDDGYLRVEGDEPGALPRIFMSLATYRALVQAHVLPHLRDRLGEHRGTFLLPRSVIEPEPAEDLRLGLSLVDPEPSEHCIYPPCSLPAETVHEDGFPLCGEHAALMRGWDDLLV